MKQEKRNFYLKMHEACATDDLRPVMQHVYFDNGFMVSTDAHILVKAAVQKFSDFDRSEVEILNGKLIHKSTFKKILSCGQVIVTADGIQDLATKDIYRFSELDAKFPNYEAVIPKQHNPIECIGISPNYTSRLMKVLNSSHIINVKVEFTAANNAIKLSGLGENEGALQAILMPVMLES